MVCLGDEQRLFCHFWDCILISQCPIKSFMRWALQTGWKLIRWGIAGIYSDGLVVCSVPSMLAPYQVFNILTITFTSRATESESVSHSVMSVSVWPHGPQLARLLCPWNPPGKSTGVGCHFLLQGIFLTQASNPGLLHCRQILYQLTYKGGSKVKVTQLCPTLCDPMGYTVHGTL